MQSIDLSAKKKAQLRREFDVSRVTVWSALTYQTNSALAERIRRRALLLGGRLLDVVEKECFVPNCEIEFIRGDDGRLQRIAQTFSNKVRVEFDNDDCSAVIFCDEEPVNTFEDVRMCDWCDIISEAQNLSESLNK